TDQLPALASIAQGVEDVRAQSRRRRAGIDPAVQRVEEEDTADWEARIRQLCPRRPAIPSAVERDVLACRPASGGRAVSEVHLDRPDEAVLADHLHPVV